MKFIISGKNIDVTPGLKAAIEDKIGKLEKYFTPETEVQATLSVEKERQKIEVTIPMKGNIIRSEQVSSDMYVSIDLAAGVIERQLKKYKNKFRSEQQAGAASVRTDFIEMRCPTWEKRARTASPTEERSASRSSCAAGRRRRSRAAHRISPARHQAV